MPYQINKNAFVQRLRARFKKAPRQTNKKVFVGGLRARMKIQEGLEKMATEKTLINHLRGLKIIIRPNPKVEPNNAKISLNITDYASFEKEKKEGTEYMRELARLERCSKIDAGMSKASLLFSLQEWASKGISLSRHNAKMGGDLTKKEIFKSEEEEHIQELEGMLSTADLICRNLDIIESYLLAEKRAKVEGGKGEKKEKDDEKGGNGEKDNDDDKGIKADAVKKEGEDGVETDAVKKEGEDGAETDAVKKEGEDGVETEGNVAVKKEGEDGAETEGNAAKSKDSGSGSDDNDNDHDHDDYDDDHD